MSRRKRGAIVAAVLAALACLLLVRGRCNSGSSDTASQTSSGRPRPEAQGRAAAAVDPGARWSLYGQRNVARRRIAGRVSFEGQPFAGARLSLRWMGMESGIAAPPPVVSDASGRFDLCAWFAERFVVTAAAEGKTAAVAEVDLRDPVAAPPPDRPGAGRAGRSVLLQTGRRDERRARIRDPGPW